VQFNAFSFGSIEIDDATYDHDLVIDRGKISHVSGNRPGRNTQPLGNLPFRHFLAKHLAQFGQRWGIMLTDSPSVPNFFLRLASSLNN